MTQSEQTVYNRKIKEGYEVLHKGCPDFLCFKDGKISFIEVKMGNDRLTEEQERFIAILRSVGLQVDVEYIKPLNTSINAYDDILGQDEVLVRCTNAAYACSHRWLIKGTVGAVNGQCPKCGGESAVIAIRRRGESTATDVVING